MDEQPGTSSRDPRSTGYVRREQEIEEDLRTGENHDLLAEYFGGELHARLEGLASEIAALKERRRAEVILLPGLLGSKLGRPGKLVDEVIWLDPFEIHRGKLAELRLDATEVEPLGALLLAYLPVKMGLTLRGWPTSLWAYDWRREPGEVLDALCRRISESEAEEVHLVGHSLGGLIARAAHARRPGRVGKVITCGTPHQGALATVQLLRGSAPLLHRLAALDPERDAVGLARRVFHGFPSVYHLLPGEAIDPEGRTLDPARWPPGLRPSGTSMEAGRRFREGLPAAGRADFSIVGIHQPTVTAIEPGGDEEGFRYHLTEEGDGTVPVASARLADAPAWYVEQGHGSLLASTRVVAAISDLLDGGDTDALPDHPSWRGDTSENGAPPPVEARGRADAEAPSTTSDAQLAADFERLLENIDDARDLSDARQLIREFAAPLG